MLPAEHVRIAARRGLCCLKHRTVASGFSGWRAWVLKRRVKRTHAIRAVKYWRFAALAHRWEAWRLYTWHQLAKAENIKCAEAHARSMFLRHSITAFRKHTMRQRRLREAQGYFANVVFSRAFLCWRAAIQRRRMLRQVMHTIAARWRLLLVASAFGQWRWFAAWSVDAQSKLQTALARWRYRTVASVFAAWKDYSTRRLCKRDRLARAISYWSNGALRSALRAWFEVCVALRVAHDHWCVMQIVELIWRHAHLGSGWLPTMPSFLSKERSSTFSFVKQPGWPDDEVHAMYWCLPGTTVNRL